MPTLSLAQFILTLWLLAAVAPAAKVFIQESWRAIGADLVTVRGRCEPPPHVAKEVAKPKKAAPTTAMHMERTARRAACSESFWTTDFTQDRIASVSLLHTALQRHRPRLA